jgi:ankyrin repeat protein
MRRNHSRGELAGIFCIGLLLLGAASLHKLWAGTANNGRANVLVDEDGPAVSLLAAIGRGDVTESRRQVLSYPRLLNSHFGPVGRTLHLAISMKKDQIALMLIDQGADLSPGGAYGWTPLHTAAYMGSADVVNALLARHADVEARCKVFGATPLFWAARGEKMRGNMIGRYVDVSRMLLENGAKADTRNRKGISAASIAGGDMAKLLQQYGAPVEDERAPEQQPKLPRMEQRVYPVLLET